MEEEVLSLKLKNRIELGMWRGQKKEYFKVYYWRSVSK